MVVEDIGDGEGDFLRRIRKAVGPEAPIACSLDLHANISPEMVGHSDFMSAYRTYPHVDMRETGRRTAQVLFNMCRSGTRFAKALVQTPYLIPIPSQCTLAEPTSSIYTRLEQIEREHRLHLSFAPGFPPSDTLDCGPAIVGYGREEDPALDRHMQSFADCILKAETAYARDRIFNEGEGVSLSLEVARIPKPQRLHTGRGLVPGSRRKLAGVQGRMALRHSKQSSRSLLWETENSMELVNSMRGAQLTLV